MKYLQSNIIQLGFMLLAFSLLVYGFLNDKEFIMAISSVIAMVVWFIDSYKNTKNVNKLEKELTATKNKVDEVEDNQKWIEL